MSVKTRIGVIGSRERNSPEDKEILRKYLKELILILGGFNNVIFVSGFCRKGGDKFSEEIALEDYGQEFLDSMIIHKPDESKLNKDLLKVNSRAAYREINYMRNDLIARDSDILVSLCKVSRTGGAENTIKTFKRIKNSKGRIHINTGGTTWLIS